MKVTHIQVKIEAHEGLGAGGGQLREVRQVADARAVEVQDLGVVDLLVAQRGVAGQHLGQHHYLRSHPNTFVNSPVSSHLPGSCSGPYIHPGSCCALAPAKGNLFAVTLLAELGCSEARRSKQEVHSQQTDLLLYELSVAVQSQVHQPHRAIINEGVPILTVQVRLAAHCENDACTLSESQLQPASLT